MSQYVSDFYNANPDIEFSRLDHPYARIEFLSTLRLIKAHFPSHARVADIGGGPGRYALELARLGHHVTLVDLAERSVEQARSTFAQAGHTAERMLTGDARDLSMIEDQSFDAELFLGPLYHLIDPIERQTALAELHRILRPGAVAIVAFLNSWGLLRTGLSDFPDRFRDDAFARSLLAPRDFERALSGFTECHWATPPSARANLLVAGFEILTYAGR